MESHATGTKVHVLSDIHLERHDVYPGVDAFLPPATSRHIDVLLLCGDIGDPGSAAYATFLRDAAARCRVAVYVILGNHEMYGRTPREAAAAARAACEAAGATFLDNETADVPGTDLRVAGTTLWSDIDPYEARMIRCLVQDFRAITDWDVSDHVEAFHRSVAWLRAACVMAEVDGKRLVVMTHHVPLMWLGRVKHAASPLKSAFASDLRALVEHPAVVMWAYGHDHHSVHKTVGDNGRRVVIVSNQAGYPGEDDVSAGHHLRFEPVVLGHA